MAADNNWWNIMTEMIRFPFMKLTQSAWEIWYLFLCVLVLLFHRGGVHNKPTASQMESKWGQQCWLNTLHHGHHEEANQETERQNYHQKKIQDPKYYHLERRDQSKQKPKLSQFCRDRDWWSDLKRKCTQLLKLKMHYISKFKWIQRALGNEG